MTMPRYRMGAYRLGFWSLDLRSGLLTCCTIVAAILDIPGIAPSRVAAVLLRIHPADRRSLLRAGLASMTRGQNFDRAVRIQVQGRETRLRIIGGRGYGRDEHRELHGIVEEFPPT